MRPDRLRTLFWGCAFGLVALTAPLDVRADEAPQTVQVPVAEMEKLRAQFIAMRERIAKLEQIAGALSDRAQACMANNDWSGSKWRQ